MKTKHCQMNIRMSETLRDGILQRAKEMRMPPSAYVRTLLVESVELKAAVAEEDVSDRRATGSPESVGIRQIHLTRGLVALVDNADFDRVNQHKWNCLNHGAAQARIGKDRVQMHRFILGITDGKIAVDHINHNRLDNRRCNLRIATHSQNSGNKASYRKDGKYKGVIDSLRGRDPKVGNFRYGRSCLPQKRYQAKITCQGTTHLLGGYPTPEAAARAYDAKARELYGEFACPNFPESASV